MNSPESPHDQGAPGLSLYDLREAVQDRWRFLGTTQKFLALLGSILILIGLGLAFADLFTAGILFAIAFDLSLVAAGVGAFLWLGFRVKILTRGPSHRRQAQGQIDAKPPPPTAD